MFTKTNLGILVCLTVALFQTKNTFAQEISAYFQCTSTINVRHTDGSFEVIEYVTPYHDEQQLHNIKPVNISNECVLLNLTNNDTIARNVRIYTVPQVRLKIVESKNNPDIE